MVSTSTQDIYLANFLPLRILGVCAVLRGNEGLPKGIFAASLVCIAQT